MNLEIFRSTMLRSERQCFRIQKGGGLVAAKPLPSPLLKKHMQIASIVSVSEEPIPIPIATGTIGRVHRR